MTTFSTLPSLPTFLPGTNPATDGDTFLAALPTLVSQGNTIGTEVQTNYDNSYEYNKRVNISLVRLAAYLASSSSNSTLATSLRNAALWVSGTTYSLNTYVFSPINFRLYRRKVAGAGTTDPSLDTSNWNLVALETGTNLPSIRPTLSLNFTAGEVLDYRITFSRSSSATRYNRKGLIETVGVNQPRFDYDPFTLQAKGLLIEESRTNLLLRSEEFDNASWAKARVTVSANATTAPDGTLTADKLVEDTTASSTHFIEQTATTISGTAYTFSVYVKASGRTKLSLSAYTNTSASVFFDLSAVTASNPSIGAISSVGNGWYRCSLTLTSGFSGTSYFDVYLQDSGGSSSYTGDGSSGIYVWGAQLEAGAFPTSYIPTTSTAVTRSADTASISGTNFSSWFNSLEGTFVTNTEVQHTSETHVLNVTRGLGTYGPRMQLNTPRQPTLYNVNDSSAIDANLGSSSANNSQITAFSYKNNQLIKTNSGTLSLNDTAVSIPTSLAELRIGNSSVSTLQLGGWFKTLYFYRRAIPVLEMLESTIVS